MEIVRSVVRSETLLKTDSVTDFKNRFQANYTINFATLVEAILLPYCRGLIEHVLVLQGMSIATIQKNFGKKSTKASRNTSKNIWSNYFSFFIPKQ